jgi:hypothetical protein
MQTFAPEYILLRYSDIIKIKSINLFGPFNTLIENTLSLECTKTLQYNLRFGSWKTCPYYT